MLLNREMCIGILPIMMVFRCGGTTYFRGLWNLPPGMSRTDWGDLYGIEAGTIKPGKEVREVLRRRTLRLLTIL